MNQLSDNTHHLQILNITLVNGINVLCVHIIHSLVLHWKIINNVFSPREHSSLKFHIHIYLHFSFHKYTSYWVTRFCNKINAVIFYWNKTAKESISNTDLYNSLPVNSRKWDYSSRPICSWRHYLHLVKFDNFPSASCL
jgi:hypothetical protein